MKVYLTECRPVSGNQGTGLCTIHFSREIPWVVFTRMDFSCEFNPFVDCYADKFMDFDMVASKAVKANVGRSAIEITDSFETIRGFLVSLTHLDGVENLVDQSRYSLSFHIAPGFSPRQLAIDAGHCVQQYFYSSEEVLLEQVVAADSEVNLDPPVTGRQS